MSRLRKQLQQIAQNTNLPIKNSSTLSTKEFYTKTLAKLESTLYEETGFQEVDVLAIHLTTSRDPSSFLITFTKHLANLLNMKYLPRGRATLNDLSKMNVMVLGEVKGKINSLVVSTKTGASFYFGVSNVKLNRETKRLGRIDLVTHNLKTPEIQEVRDKKYVAFDLFYRILARMFPKYDKGRKEKKFKENKKSRKIGFLKGEESDLISFFSFEGNEFFTSFDLKMFKCVKGDIEFEGEEIWKAREFLNSS